LDEGIFIVSATYNPVSIVTRAFLTDQEGENISI
jgi:hypothetical protein